ncbi:MAG: 50S ribosomal protein L18e [Halobacteriota archaeon]|jgi:large subunit ribosomal protein L18e
MAKQKTEKTNPQLDLLRETLKVFARKHQADIWKELARRLDAPSSNYAKVNLSRLNRYTNSGDVVIVLGKVLGAGSINHPISIGALNFSENARLKLLAAAGTVVTIDEIIQGSPTGSDVKIIR